MDTDYKNKLLQISHGDKQRANESLDTPEKRRAATRRLLQKMQEGPVPDINTEKGLVEEDNEKSNAIVRQLEEMEDEEPEASLSSAKRRTSRPALL